MDGTARGAQGLLVEVRRRWRVVVASGRGRAGVAALLTWQATRPTLSTASISFHHTVDTADARAGQPSRHPAGGSVRRAGRQAQVRGAGCRRPWRRPQSLPSRSPRRARRRHQPDIGPALTSPPPTPDPVQARGHRPGPYAEAPRPAAPPRLRDAARAAGRPGPGPPSSDDAEVPWRPPGQPGSRSGNPGLALALGLLAGSAWSRPGVPRDARPDSEVGIEDVGAVDAPCPDPRSASTPDASAVRRPAAGGDSRRRPVAGVPSAQAPHQHAVRRGRTTTRRSLWSAACRRARARIHDRDQPGDHAGAGQPASRARRVRPPPTAHRQPTWPRWRGRHHQRALIGCAPKRRAAEVRRHRPLGARERPDPAEPVGARCSPTRWRR